MMTYPRREVGEWEVVWIGEHTLWVDETTKYESIGPESKFRIRVGANEDRSMPASWVLA